MLNLQTWASVRAVLRWMQSPKEGQGLSAGVLQCVWLEESKRPAQGPRTQKENQRGVVSWKPSGKKILGKNNLKNEC